MYHGYKNDKFIGKKENINYLRLQLLDWMKNEQGICKCTEFIDVCINVI